MHSGGGFAFLTIDWSRPLRAACPKTTIGKVTGQETSATSRLTSRDTGDSIRNFRFGPPAATWYTLSSPEHNEFAAGRQAAAGSKRSQGPFLPPTRLSRCGAGDFSDTPPELPASAPKFCFLNRTTSRRALVAPRSSATCRRTTAGGDAPLPIATRSSAHAPRAVRSHTPSQHKGSGTHLLVAVESSYSDLAEALSSGDQDVEGNAPKAPTADRAELVEQLRATN